VDDPVPVQAALERSAYIVKTTPVIALEIPDEAGSLNHILQILADGGRNVEYMYGFTGRKTNAAFMVIRTTDVQKTEEVLAAAGIRTVSQAEVPQL
jgi:hypothetical protein